MSRGVFIVDAPESVLKGGSMFREIAARLGEWRKDALGEGTGDDGFTLIELMVVLLIMAILLAIAIPTFLGVKGGAQDRAAQSNLETALQNAKAVYANNSGSYGLSAAAIVNSLTSSEPSLTFVNDATAPPATNPQNTISVGVDITGNAIIVVTKSQAGDCWGIETNEVTAQPGNVAGTAYPAWPTLAAGNDGSAGTQYIVFKGAPCTVDQAAAYGNTAVAGSTSGWTVTKYPSAV
jgi:type IV pilus assembly protein PilA